MHSNYCYLAQDQAYYSIINKYPDQDLHWFYRSNLALGNPLIKYRQDSIGKLTIVDMRIHFGHLCRGGNNLAGFINQRGQSIRVVSLLAFPVPFLNTAKRQEKMCWPPLPLRAALP